MKNLNSFFRLLTILAGSLFIPIIIIQVLIFFNTKAEIPSEVDYVIILGARVKGKVPTKSLEARIKVAAEYLKENKKIKVIASGGQGKNEEISEAAAIRASLIEKGIPESRIITEAYSKSTAENLKFSMEAIEEDRKNNSLIGFPKERKIRILIATNDYHLFRAKNIAEDLGYEAYGLPAETPLISIPKSYIREFLAIIKFYYSKI